MSEQTLKDLYDEVDANYPPGLRQPIKDMLVEGFIIGQAAEQASAWAPYLAEKAAAPAGEFFTTSDSGVRHNFPSGMVRDTNTGKPRFDLICPADLPYGEQMLTRWAQHMTRGAEKYAARNWEKASSIEERDRAKESAFRHFMQWYLEAGDGEDHAVAVFFNITEAEYVSYRLEREGLCHG